MSYLWKKLQFGSVLIILLATGCSKKNDATPAPCVTTPYLKSIVGSSGYTLNFTRNNKNLVTRIDYTIGTQSYSCTVEYDGTDRITTMVDGLQSSTYLYDASSRVSSMDILRRPDRQSAFALMFRFTYHYNGEGKLDTMYTNSGQYKRYVYDANGNLTKTYSAKTGSAEILESENLTFDDKTCATNTARFYQLRFISLAAQPWATVVKIPWVSEHNATSVNATLAGGSVVNTNYHFSYNATGLTASATQSGEQYTYGCQ